MFRFFVDSGLLFFVFRDSEIFIRVCFLQNAFFIFKVMFLPKNNLAVTRNNLSRSTDEGANLFEVTVGY